MTSSKQLRSILGMGVSLAMVAIFCVPSTVQAKTKLDTGFNRQVSLKLNKGVTASLTAPLTYSWTQTGGKEVTLSATDVAHPTFTTDPITEFVAIPDGKVGLVAMDTHQVEESTYTFRCIVTDATSTVVTGTASIVCGSMTLGQPNIPLGVNQNFTTLASLPTQPGADYEWTLVSKPEGSQAALENAATRNPALRPDVEGEYEIHDAVTDTTITVTGATWVGVDTCAVCHLGPNGYVPEFGLDDLVTPWSETGHASMAQRGVDGIASSHYGESCLACHTVGRNLKGSAVNGGFDDIAKQVGWTFPSVLQPGNYDAMPDALKAVSNIQCESCHGPGGTHPGEASVSYDYMICATCHQDGSHHVYPEQWENGPHSEGFLEVSEEEGDRNTCSRCHSPVGFAEHAKRLDAGDSYFDINDETATGIGALSCQGCHDPHAVAGNAHQLRVYDKATVGQWALQGDINIAVPAMGAQELLRGEDLQYATVTLTGLGASATCVECHNGRRLAQNQNGDSGIYGETGSPHDSLAAEALYGICAWDYGIKMGNSYHTYYAQCTTCHMYTDNTDGNRLGDHSFTMAYTPEEGEEVQNLDACNQCHQYFEEVDKFDFVSVIGGDYDGDGELEGVQSETQGLIDLVGGLLEDSGLAITRDDDGHVTGLPRGATYSEDPDINKAQHQAVWNMLTVIREGSHGVHNTQFTTRLLQTTYTKFNEAVGGNSFIEDYPDAYLR